MKKAALLLLLGLGLSACATTEITPVEETVRAVTQAQHSEIDVAKVLEQASEKFDAESYQESFELYHQIVIRDAGHVAAGIGFGNAALALGRIDVAAKQFNTMSDVGVDPEYQDAVSAGLVLAGLLGETIENPLEHIDRTLQHIEDDPRLWNAKGRIHDQRQEWILALDAYVLALKTGKAQSGVINNMGMSLMKQSRFDEALLKFEHALEIKPTSRLYENNRRMALFLQNDMRQGLKDIPSDRAAALLNDAGYIAMQLDRPALAKMLFKHAIKTSPSYHVKAVKNLEALEEITKTSGA